MQVESLALPEVKVLRPRVYLYAALGLVGLVVASVSLYRRTDFEAAVVRQPGLPYVLEGGPEDGSVRNALTLRLVNKRAENALLRVRAVPALGHADDAVLLPMERVRLPPMGDATVPLFVRAPRASWRGGYVLSVRVEREGADPSEGHTLEVPVLGP